MKFIQRLGYYLGGFSLGLIILAFFLSGKKTSCSYGPEARVLKNINSKTIVYDEKMKPLSTDSTVIHHAFKNGNVNFSKSNSRQKPCGTYVIESHYNKKKIRLTVENCDSIATVLNFKIE